MKKILFLLIMVLAVIPLFGIINFSGSADMSLASDFADPKMIQEEGKDGVKLLVDTLTLDMSAVINAYNFVAFSLVLDQSIILDPRNPYAYLKSGSLTLESNILGMMGFRAAELKPWFIAGKTTHFSPHNYLSGTRSSLSSVNNLFFDDFVVGFDFRAFEEQLVLRLGANPFLSTSTEGGWDITTPWSSEHSLTSRYRFPQAFMSLFTEYPIAEYNTEWGIEKSFLNGEVYFYMADGSDDLGADSGYNTWNNGNEPKGFLHTGLNLNIMDYPIGSNFFSANLGVNIDIPRDDFTKSLKDNGFQLGMGAKAVLLEERLDAGFNLCYSQGIGTLGYYDKSNANNTARFGFSVEGGYQLIEDSLTVYGGLTFSDLIFNIDRDNSNLVDDLMFTSSKLTDPINQDIANAGAEIGFKLERRNFAYFIGYTIGDGAMYNNLTISDNSGTYNYQDSFFMRAKTSF